MTDITMPQLGETITEGTITKWFKTVGETVSEDEVLYEVSTDKVDSEVPSPCSGTVLEIRVPEGETVDVGAVLAVIGEAEMAAPSPAPPLLPEPVLSAPPARPDGTSGGSRSGCRQRAVVAGGPSPADR